MSLTKRAAAFCMWVDSVTSMDLQDAPSFYVQYEVDKIREASEIIKELQKRLEIAEAEAGMA